MRKRYSQWSEGKKVRHRLNMRKGNLRRRLEEWQREGRNMKSIPTLREYLHGAELIYKSFGLTNDDVYIPPFVRGNELGYKKTEMEKEKDRKERQRFKYKKYGNYSQDNGKSLPAELNACLSEAIERVMK